MDIIDAHTHVQFPQFDEDRDEVITRAKEKGIGMVQIGTDIVTSQKAYELALQHNDMWATAGIHPHEAVDIKVFPLEEMKSLLSQDIVIGVGECGFDFYNMSQEERRSARELQQSLFEEQIALSVAFKKPLVIHTRDAFEETLSVLEEQAQKHSLRGIAHFFTGGREEAQRFLDLGFYFTFGGLITHNRSFDDVIRFIPKERVLVETDAPYVAPAGQRGKRNEPSYIIETMQALADIYNEPYEKVKERVRSNTKAIFGI